MNKATVLRIGKAIVNGWGIQWPYPPRSKTDTGGVWIMRPGDKDKWKCFKSVGRNWLSNCLDEGGIPK